MKHDRHMLAAIREALLTNLQPEMHPGTPLWLGLDAWSWNTAADWEHLPLPSRLKN